VTDYVVLVDEHDQEIGTEEKLRAHAVPMLHRAVSVVVCHSDGRLLMQQRSLQKYHSAGLWSNTCCGHPRPGESPIDAASRRLAEEMGIQCILTPAHVLSYRLDVGDGLIEHELNRVFVGTFDGMPRPDAREVAGWTWAGAETVRSLRRHHAATLTAWFDPVVTSLSVWAETATTLPPTLRQAIRGW
jgi:isopentenyl-diphosphate delta-isomerase